MAGSKLVGCGLNVAGQPRRLLTATDGTIQTTSSGADGHGQGGGKVIACGKTSSGQPRRILLNADGSVA